MRHGLTLCIKSLQNSLNFLPLFTCEPGYHVVTLAADVHAFKQDTHVTAVDRTLFINRGSSGFLLTVILKHGDD